MSIWRPWSIASAAGAVPAALDHQEVDFCIEALEEALARHGKPEICNTDQGSQFTSETFTGLLIKNGIKISMVAQ